MLYMSYKTILQKGFYVKGSFKEYKLFSLHKLSTTYYGISKYRFYIILNDLNINLTIQNLLKFFN